MRISVWKFAVYAIKAYCSVKVSIQLLLHTKNDWNLEKIIVEKNLARKYGCCLLHYKSKTARSELRLNAQVAAVYQGIICCCILHIGTASPGTVKRPGPDFSHI